MLYRVVATSGRERVEAALALDVADRPPISAWGHSLDKEWGVDSLVAVTVGEARRHTFDFVKAPNSRDLLRGGVRRLLALLRLAHREAGAR